LLVNIQFSEKKEFRYFLFSVFT